MLQDPKLPVRRSIRLPHFDYSQPAAYFLTICTHEKQCLLGAIVGAEVALGARGRIVDECWREIPTHFPNVEVPTHVVMPNHLHGIVVLRRRVTSQAPGDSRPAENAAPRRIGALGTGSIPAIVRSFKAITTRRVRERLGESALALWQRSYYERVIRNEDEFRKTSEYIRLNPARWAFDEENS
jgi:putative transposase